jgi:proteasome lid subunit RPN8/RPN11
MKYGKWRVPMTVVRATEAAMTGRQHEVFALWTAELDVEAEYREQAQIEQLVVPEQQPGWTPHGVYVHIVGSELQRIQLDNYERGQRSIVQLHTHPSEDVRMSGLDREWEVVAHVGALSIIVPKYCAHGLSLTSGANIYEREEDDWRLWSAQEARERIALV